MYLIIVNDSIKWTKELSNEDRHNKGTILEIRESGFVYVLRGNNVFEQIGHYQSRLAELIKYPHTYIQAKIGEMNCICGGLPIDQVHNIKINT